MAGVIIFLDKTDIPNDLMEVHFFENDRELIQFSTAHIHRKQLVKGVPAEAWHRMPTTPLVPPTPGPATKNMLAWCVDHPGFSASPTFQAFLKEWLDPATSLLPEQLTD